MSARHFSATVCTLALSVATCTSVCGQAYPSKPIRIVASKAGSGSEFAVRLTSPGLA